MATNLSLEIKNSELVQENKNLRSEIKSFKSTINDCYSTIEKMNKKMDGMFGEIAKLNIDVANLKIENDTLKDKNENLIQTNIKLGNEVDRLKKQINNDSNNSSNPPSSDIKPNIPNNRIKSNKNIGGQFGHKAHYLSKKDVEAKIKNKEFEHEIIDIGFKSDKYISKYILDVFVSVKAKEYRFYINENGKYNIPKEFLSDVQYGNNLKTMCSVLNTEGIVAIDRLTDFVSSITNGKLSLSNGSIVNFINTLSSKSLSVIDSIKTKILNSKLMYTDATAARCDNRNISVRNYSTQDYTLLLASKGKAKKYIEESKILTEYVGDLVHDHETVMYNYGNRHGECNVHVCRYLKGNYENTKNKWSISMKSLLNCLNEYKKQLKQSNIVSISDEKLEKYSKRYDEIISQGYIENIKVKSKYLKKEECRLLNRLNKYKENHLLFIRDFGIPFDNNLSERDLRQNKKYLDISKV